VVSAQVGFDLDLLIVPVETLSSIPLLSLASLPFPSAVEKTGENRQTVENWFYVAAQVLQGILCKLVRDLFYS
jgi:hypothetical protein